MVPQWCAIKNRKGIHHLLSFSPDTTKTLRGILEEKSPRVEKHQSADIEQNEEK